MHLLFHCKNVYIFFKRICEVAFEPLLRAAEINLCNSYWIDQSMSQVAIPEDLNSKSHSSVKFKPEGPMELQSD